MADTKRVLIATQGVATFRAGEVVTGLSKQREDQFLKEGVLVLEDEDATAERELIAAAREKAAEDKAKVEAAAAEEKAKADAAAEEKTKAAAAAAAKTANK